MLGRGIAHAEGVSFEAAIGYPEVTLRNPNGTEAIYSGLAALGRLYAPLFANKGFAANLVFSGRYVDLNNNGNSATQRETGNHIGLGAGLHLKFYKIVLGASYHMVKARHFWVGDIKDLYTEFEYPLTSYYLGLEWKFSKNFGLSTTYEMATAEPEIEKNAIPYNENTLWLHFRFDTDKSFGNFLGLLFK